jgi:hypothetical protein
MGITTAVGTEAMQKAPESVWMGDITQMVILLQAIFSGLE